MWSILPLGGDAEGHGADAEGDGAEDGRVLFPVRRLRVPPSGGGPDVCNIVSSAREGDGVDMN